MQAQNYASNKPDAPKTRRPFLEGLLTGGLVGSLIASGGAAFAGGEHHSNYWKAGGCGYRHGMQDPALMKERADFMAE